MREKREGAGQVLTLFEPRGMVAGGRGSLMFVCFSVKTLSAAMHNNVNWKGRSGQDLLSRG